MFIDIVIFENKIMKVYALNDSAAIHHVRDD